MTSNRNVLAIQVKLDGSTKIGPFDLKDGNHIRKVEVDLRLDSPAYFSVTIKSGDVAASSARRTLSLRQILASTPSSKPRSWRRSENSMALSETWTSGSPTTQRWVG